MDEIDFLLLKAIDKTRNLTKAADQVNMTQSALSKRIRAMEEELDTTIFLRTHSGVRFTATGEKVLQSCSLAAKEISDLKLFLKKHDGEIYGSLTIGVSDNYMQYHLADVIETYNRKYPHVTITFKTDKGHLIYPRVLGNSIDLGIIRGEYEWDGLKILLSRESMCVVRNKELETIPLENCNYIDRTTDSTQSELMYRWRRENKMLRCKTMITLDSISSCMELVRRGMGWALIPEVALKDYKGSIKPCYFQNGEPFVRSTYIYCKTEVAKLPQVKAFINEAVEKKITYPFGGAPIQMWNNRIK